MTATRSPDEVLAQVPKNAAEVLQVRRTVYNGRDLIDVRSWLRSAVPGGEPSPTKKGLSLPPATWRLLLPEIAAAVADDEGEAP